MEYALALIFLVGGVAYVVLKPFRTDPDQLERTEDELRAALEAAKEAKYREIRDAELDHRMGKMSKEDWRATDRELRTQAVALLKQIDELPPAEDDAEPPAADENGSRAR